MSKRKGRKSARSSEIKSVLRAPPEGENELEAESTEAGDTDPDSLPLDVLADAVEHDGAAAARAETAVESEPAPPVESATARRQQRLRAVRAVAPDAAEPVASDGEVGSARDDAEGREHGDGREHSEDGESEAGDSTVAEEQDEQDADVERSANRGRGRDDSEDAAGADDDADSNDGGAPFVPFPIDAEGDDTEGFLRGLLEALLFTSQKPLDLKDLARSAGIDKPRAKELVEQLMASYEGRGLCIEQVAGGFVMRSSPRYSPYIQKILALRPVRLSRAQLETLAIVAYRQPVTKPEVDDIRGVDSGQVIKGLLERSLLKMLGKKDEPGRPTLYGTTNEFLDLLNLQSLKDLPTLREYTELSEESQRKFQEETGETPPSGAISFERPPAHPADASLTDAEDTETAEQPEAMTTESDDDAETGDDESGEGDARVTSSAGDDEAAPESGEAEAAEHDAIRAAAEDEESDDDDDESDDDDDESDDDESDEDADSSDDESDDDDDESDDDDDESDDDEDDDSDDEK